MKYLYNINEYFLYLQIFCLFINLECLGYLECIREKSFPFWQRRFGIKYIATDNT